MHIVTPYPSFPEGAVAYPFAVRKLKGSTYVKARIGKSERFYETAGRVNGYYPIRRELVPDSRLGAIELSAVKEAFAEPA